MRGLIFVGEVGVAGRPEGDGRFQISVPEGTYQLKVIGRDGVLTTKAVTVAKADVDLGAIEIGAEAREEEPPPKAAAPGKPGAKTPPPKATAAPAAARAPPKAKTKKEDDEIKLEP
jgi:hypothetical protein